jgi:quinol monooxygenase YgiN
MYVATMEYPLLPEANPADAARIWKDTVVEAARHREGFIRMQCYSAPRALLAIGTWEAKEHAEAFMRTGVFAVLKDQLGPFLAGDPSPRLWTLEAFVTR